jgi:hypothetical protein
MSGCRRDNMSLKKGTEAQKNDLLKQIRTTKSVTLVQAPNCIQKSKCRSRGTRATISVSSVWIPAYATTSHAQLGIQAPNTLGIMYLSVHETSGKPAQEQTSWCAHRSAAGMVRHVASHPYPSKPHDNPRTRPLFSDTERVPKAFGSWGAGTGSNV